MSDTPKHTAPDVERALVGMCVTGYDDVHHEIYDALSDEDFYSEAHRVIFRACRAIHERGEATSTVAVVTELKRNGDFKTAGGGAYVSECGGHGAITAGVKQHIRRLKQLAKLRNARQGAYNFLLRTKDKEPEDIDAELDLYAREACEAAEDDTAQDDSMAAAMAETLTSHREAMAARHDDKHPSVPISIPGLAKLLSGWRPGKLVIVAARPGMGKTAYLFQELKHAAGNGIPAGAFSLEMERTEICARFLAAETRVPVTKQLDGDFDIRALDAMIDAGAKLGAQPLQIDDTPGRSVEAICRRARTWVQRHGVRVIGIDYLQLMGDSPGQSRLRSDQKIGHRTKTLKRLARELGICVIVLSQLNRNLEHRQDKRPIMADIRESGRVEEDADVIVFLYSPERYAKDAAPGTVHVSEIRVAKHRQGSVGMVRAHFDKVATTFTETSDREPPPWHRDAPPPTAHWTDDRDEDLPL